MKEINENRVLECYQKYKNTVFNLAYSYCKSVTQAEDVFQDVFEKFMQKTPDFTDEYHEKEWFIRVTINACKNVLKLKWNIQRKESAVQTQLQRGREKIRRSLTEKGVSYETES